MYSNVIGLYEAGGFGREVVSVLASNVHNVLHNYTSGINPLCFIDDDPNLKEIQGGKFYHLINFSLLQVAISSIK